MILSNEKPLIPKLSYKGLFLTVTLDGTKNQVWRSLVVPADGHLGWLHAVLQISMGWTARHLHQFTFKDKRFSDPSFELYDPLTIDEAKRCLDKLLVRPTDALKYQYDFGASWEHTAYSDESGHPFRFVSDTDPTISDSGRSEATLGREQ
jgi:hypothetical protein